MEVGRGVEGEEEEEIPVERKHSLVPSSHSSSEPKWPYLHSAYEITPSLFLSNSAKNRSSLAPETVTPELEKAFRNSALSISPLWFRSMLWNIFHSPSSVWLRKAWNSGGGKYPNIGARLKGIPSKFAWVQSVHTSLVYAPVAIRVDLLDNADNHLICVFERWEEIVSPVSMTRSSETHDGRFFLGLSLDHVGRCVPRVECPVFPRVWQLFGRVRPLTLVPC